ncbi:MAG: DUF4476 domain-containing protein [Proteobacteria bacterium]|nr:DUF4476 domain-containing protein [Pseudomonadota bacterium]
MVARVMTSSLRALVVALAVALPVAASAQDKDKDEESAPDLPFELTTPETAPVAPEAAPAPVVEAPIPTGEEAIRLLSQALDRIAALQMLLGSTEGVDQAKALVELEEARHSLQAALIEVGCLQHDSELRVWLRSEGLMTAEPAVEDDVVVETEETPAPPAGLAPDTFRALVAAIDGVSFTEGKMDVLTRELAAETVTSEQASRLVELFSFSRDRVDALVFLHPRIVDVENFDSLLSALKFESDRETVRNQLGLDG